MKKKNIHLLTQAAMIAALYVVLTFIANAFGLANYAVQVRFSEALTILPLFTPAGIPGLAEAAAMDRGALFALDGMTDDLRGELGRLLDASPAPDAGETRGPAEPAVETIECPECGAEITIDAGAAVDMVTCPNCGVGLSVEYEDE